MRRELEADAFLRIIAEAEICLLSAVSLLEASMVLAGRAGSAASWVELDELLATAEIEVVPQDKALAEAARTCFLRYGNGRHPAGLNLGDCATYALARSRGFPLLFKGEDFSKTDLPAAA